MDPYPHHRDGDHRAYQPYPQPQPQSQSQHPKDKHPSYHQSLSQHPNGPPGTNNSPTYVPPDGSNQPIPSSRQAIDPSSAYYHSFPSSRRHGPDRSIQRDRGGMNPSTSADRDRHPNQQGPQDSRYFSPLRAVGQVQDPNGRGGDGGDPFARQRVEGPLVGGPYATRVDLDSGVGQGMDPAEQRGWNGGAGAGGYDRAQAQGRSQEHGFGYGGAHDGSIDRGHQDFPHRTDHHPLGQIRQSNVYPPPVSSRPATTTTQTRPHQSTRSRSRSNSISNQTRSRPEISYPMRLAATTMSGVTTDVQYAVSRTSMDDSRQGGGQAVEKGYGNEYTGGQLEGNGYAQGNHMAYPRSPDMSLGASLAVTPERRSSPNGRYGGHNVSDYGDGSGGGRPDSNVHSRMPYRATSTSGPPSGRSSRSDHPSDSDVPRQATFARIDTTSTHPDRSAQHTTTRPTTGRPRGISTSSNLPRDKAALDDLDEEEKAMLSKGMFDWKEVISWRFWIRREWLWYYVGAIVLGVLVTLMTLYHQQIVGRLTPATTWMKNLTCGWLIPIGVMIVLSIPPLFGQEIVCVLCGLVWGLWIGFGIIAAGTFIGELMNFYMFRTLLRGHAIKMEKEKMNYALMAHVVREGGIMMAIMVRMSAIPGHFTTAVFSTCGMSVWTFCIACFLTLPKQLVVVYLGVALEDVNASTADKITKYAIIGASIVVTILAAWYIYWKMNKARLALYRARRAQLLTEKGEGLPLEAVPDPSSHGRSHADDSVESLQDVEAGQPVMRGGHGGQDVFDHPQNGNPYNIRYIPHGTMSVYAVDDAPGGRLGMSGDLSVPYDSTASSSTEHLNPTPFPDARPHRPEQQMVYRGDSNLSAPNSKWHADQHAGYSDLSHVDYPDAVPLPSSKAERGWTTEYGMERVSLTDDRRTMRT